LLDTDQSVEDIARDKKENRDKDKDNINVKIGKGGIKVNINGESASCIGKKRMTKSEYKMAVEKLYLDIWRRVNGYLFSFFPLLAIVSFLCLGIILDLWSRAWVVFFVPFFIEETIKIFEYRDFEKMSSASVFLSLILFFTLSYTVLSWNISWIIFFLIPLMYILGPILNHIFKWGKKYRYRALVKKYKKHHDLFENEEYDWDEDDRDDDDDENIIIENV